MSRQAIKAINWAALAERIPEAEKAAYNAFKVKSDKYLQRMMANPEALPKIDWAYYKKVVLTPGLVDKFQKEYESLSIPYPPDNYTAEIEKEKQQAAKDVENFIQQKNEEIEETRKAISKLESMLPFSQMTLEEFVDLKPDGIMLPDRVSTWPHTEETQEHNIKDDDKESSGH
ncbi:ATP synthase subunit d, mitochondrial-like [Frieseomelitta varia]|uniref:ATP synthase subunit d, mitochondrial-like n=1 Tax=Frieseomelitta varia TaxID=561572 RepID=UPI001CB699A9|nr:ATP synthase subunit d, mitochondrial-like [Frieseomelitta varia]